MNVVVDSGQWMCFNRDEVEMNKVEVVRGTEGGEKVISVVVGILKGIVVAKGAEAVNVAIHKEHEEQDHDRHNQNSLRCMTDGKNLSSRIG